MFRPNFTYSFRAFSSLIIAFFYLKKQTEQVIDQSIFFVKQIL